MIGNGTGSERNRADSERVRLYGGSARYPRGSARARFRLPPVAILLASHGNTERGIRMQGITTLGELRRSEFSEDRYRDRSVKDEMRDNLVQKLRAGEELFPGIHGYEDTVIPQVVNAVLSRHNLILLGLRGQAKSRMLRALTDLLDEHLPVVEGCEINDNPYAPICRACRDLIAARGDQTPVAFRGRDERYVEKLATPDVTIADVIGDVDPIKA